MNSENSVGGGKRNGSIKCGRPYTISLHISHLHCIRRQTFFGEDLYLNALNEERLVGKKPSGVCVIKVHVYAVCILVFKKLSISSGFFTRKWGNYL